VTAETAAVELERVRRQRGELTPNNLLDESRPSDAPLHGAFEWDDAVAAERHRITQAYQLIRSVVVEVEETAPACRAFTLVTGQDNASYIPTQEVVLDADMTKDAIARLRSQVNEAQRSLNEYVSLSRHLGRRPSPQAKVVESSLQAASDAISGM
jgi:hypothetical protein